MPNPIYSPIGKFFPQSFGGSLYGRHYESQEIFRRENWFKKNEFYADPLKIPWVDIWTLRIVREKLPSLLII